MRGTDAVLLYTDHEVSEWRARLPREIGIFGAQNAVDQSVARAESERWTQERLAAFRREHGLEGRKVLLFCGRLRTRPNAGVELLLRALERLATVDPSYLVVIIGDGEDRARLQRLASELRLEAQVRWIGAQFDERDNAPWFLSALCFVYPGPIGLSLLHAMGYGLPVITHGDRGRHNPEVAALRHGWNGMEFTDGDASDLARRIETIAADPAVRLEMSDNARTTAMADFTIDRMAERFCAAVQHARHRILNGTSV
jgi:glycosyltransferase involved in cell wall biosynthesis